MRRSTTILLGIAAFFGLLTMPASADDAPWSRLVSVNANAVSADPWHSGAPERNGLVVLP
ncbi:hypothetical protein [Streptomyces sp. RPT161]|uniref:hypothetical protein n=1 Tax=Streptomyces sp. RPT161 TaxID=3015993 RepID=UPI0022B88718|nr:hypothetical protein [Streptomyces sp. RPT161]